MYEVRHWRRRWSVWLLDLNELRFGLALFRPLTAGFFFFILHHRHLSISNLNGCVLVCLGFLFETASLASPTAIASPRHLRLRRRLFKWTTTKNQQIKRISTANRENATTHAKWSRDSCYILSFPPAGLLEISPSASLASLVHLYIYRWSALDKPRISITRLEEREREKKPGIIKPVTKSIWSTIPSSSSSSSSSALLWIGFGWRARSLLSAPGQSLEESLFWEWERERVSQLKSNPKVSTHYTERWPIRPYIIGLSATHIKKKKKKRRAGENNRGWGITLGAHTSFVVLLVYSVRHFLKRERERENLFFTLFSIPQEMRGTDRLSARLVAKPLVWKSSNPASRQGEKKRERYCLRASLFLPLWLV